MADNLIGMVFELVTHAGHSGIDLATKHANRALGFESRPLPPMPELRPLPPMPDFPFPAAVGGSTAADATVATTDNAPLRAGRTEAATEAFVPRSMIDSSSGSTERASAPPFSGAPEGFSYSDEVEAGIACPNCTRKHLGEATGAAAKAVQALQSGDERSSRLYTARVAATLSVLQRYDLTPQKLAATPPGKRAPVEAAMPCIEAARRRVRTPEEIALAWGAADESIRFARSTSPKPSDRAEVAVRLRDVDTMTSIAERGLLAPENVGATLSRLPEAQRAEAAQARDRLRAAGHALDRGGPMDVGALSTASSELAWAAASLTPAPTVEEAVALYRACRACQDTFYSAMYQSMAAQGAPS